jgi:hypothetical protein
MLYPSGITMHRPEVRHHIILPIENIFTLLIQTWNRAGIHVLGHHVAHQALFAGEWFVAVGPFAD